MNTYNLRVSTLRLIVRQGKYSGKSIKWILLTEKPKDIQGWFNRLLATSISSKPNLSMWGKAVLKDFKTNRMCLEHFIPKEKCKCIPINYESERFDTIYLPSSLLNQTIKSGVYKNEKVRDIITDQGYLRSIESKGNLKDHTLRKLKKHLIS